MRTAITDRDRGAKAVTKRVEDVRGLVMSVGVHAEAGGENIENAERHEFGLGVPQRSFIGAYADANQADVVKRMSAAVAAGLAGKGAGPRQNLEALALKCAGEVQAMIAGGIAPPNAPSTIAKKGSSTPLIDTGQLRPSITGKVEQGGGK